MCLSDPVILIPISSSLTSLYLLSVKNGLSDPTKVQDGQVQCRNDIKSDCERKAPKEGCRERERAQMGVSSTEKMNTKRGLN